MPCPEILYAARTGAQDHANAGDVRSDLVDAVVDGRRTAADAAGEIVRQINAYASDTLDGHHCADCAHAWSVTYGEAATAAFRYDVADAIARKNEDL
jgi:hypothetical protein